MLLHTIVRPEVIFPATLDNSAQDRMELEYDGVKLEVSTVDSKNFVVNRIISTNMTDYLKPDIQPGSMIELSPQPKKI